MPVSSSTEATNLSTLKRFVAAWSVRDGVLAMWAADEGSEAEILELLVLGDRGFIRWSRALAGFFGELVTTWPAVTEACHILPDYLGPALLRWLSTSRWRTVGVEN